MPSIDAASRYASLRSQEAASAKRLYAIDAVYPEGAPVTDVGALRTAACDAVAAGNGHVLADSHVVFPNGAITLVLILAESHLSIHTWPEDNLIAIDLFSCGAIDGPRVLSELAGSLRLGEVRAAELHRGPAAAGERTG